MCAGARVSHFLPQPLPTGRPSACGVAGLACGLAMAALHVPSDALVADDGEFMAVQAPGRNWLLSSERGGGRFLRDAWRRRWGGAEAVSFARADAGEGLAGFACDGLGCVLGIRGRSEERRGGKACVRTCRSRWSPCT